MATQNDWEVKPHSHSPTIGFLCPLYLERRAVQAIFDESLGSEEIDDTTYHYGLISTRKAVIVELLYEHTGPARAATYATTLIAHHPTLKQPGSYCFVVGIAGAIWSDKQDIRLGDVVIATKVWDWRSGKITKDGLEHSRYPEDAPEQFLKRLPEFLYKERLGEMIAAKVREMGQNQPDESGKWKYQGQDEDTLFHADYHHPDGYTDCIKCDRTKSQSRDSRPDNYPKVHDGIIASGEVVLKDSIHRQSLQKERVKAVEMEACGIPKSFNFIVIRGMSDYADSHKNDKWQPYAAAVAAACTRLLIDSFLKEDRPLRRHPTNQTVATTSTTVTSNGGTDSDVRSFDDDSSSHLAIPKLSVSDEGAWSDCFERVAKAVDLRIKDGGRDGGPARTSYSEAKIGLAYYAHDQLEHRRQMLFIIPSQAGPELKHVMWLPFTNVRTSRAGTLLKLAFSNCKQKSTLTYNYQTSYEAVYDPENPNVYLKIQFEDDSGSVDFESRILHKCGSLMEDMEEERYDLGAHQIQNGVINASEGVRRRCIYLWSESSDNDSSMGEITSFDLACFDSMLDFKVRTDDQSTTLYLKHLFKLRNVPEDVSSVHWPTQSIQDNKDGRPASILLDADDSSGISLSISVTSNDLLQVLQRTVGYGARCLAKDWYEIKFNVVQPRRGSISFSLPKTLKGQMTVWIRGRLLTILVRSGRDEDEKALDDCRWYSWMMKPIAEGDNDLAPPRYVRKKSNVILLEGVNLSSGDRLWLPPDGSLYAYDSQEDAAEQSTDLQHARIEFLSSDDPNRFESLINEYVTAE